MIPRSDPASQPNSNDQAALAEMVAKWPNIRQSVRACNQQVEALLASVEPVAVQGDELILMVPYAFHRDVINRDDVRSIIQAGIAEVLNKRYLVRAVATNDEKSSPTSLAMPLMPRSPLHNERPINPLEHRAMVDANSLDVKLGWYDRSSFWVEYYGTGTIGTYLPTAQLHAVIHFHESIDRPPVPVGVIMTEAPGGFLRAKRPLYQVVVGREPLSGITYVDRAEARSDVWFRALRLAAGIYYGVPEVARLADKPQRYLTEGLMYTVRWYGDWIPGRQDWIPGQQGVMLHSVVHFNGNIERPAVPFLISKYREEDTDGYIWGFSGEGENIEFVRAFPTDEAASSHIVTCIPLVAGVLMSKAQAASDFGRSMAHLDARKRADMGLLTEQEAKVRYDQLLDAMRTGPTNFS